MRSNIPNICPRAGLTLIELLVVLTILIALGGIVVSTLPGLLGKTQSATAAANVPEIDSAIRRNLIVSNGLVGNRFDSLITGSGAISGGVASYVGGAEFFQAGSLSESEVAELARIGISELVPAAETTSDATFQSHRQQPVILGTDSKVCELSAAYAVRIMEELWNITPQENDRFIVVGIGNRCSLVGGGENALFPEAPVHFSEDARTGPANMYSRYLAIIELKTDEPVSRTRARYVGIAIPSLDGLRGVSEELSEAHSNNRP